jgi:hypothetical protein
MTIELRIAKNADAEEWNNHISQSRQGTLFHTWNWLKITEKYTNTKLYPLIGIKNDAPVGLFPLFFQKKGPVRMVFSPPPHAALFYLGPVIFGFDSLKQEKRENLYIDFLNSVDNFILNDLHAQYISISLSPALLDPRPFRWSGYSIMLNYDYVTDLSIGPEQLLLTLDKNGRQNLNRARKKGIIIEIGGKKEYEAILDLMEIRYSQQGKILTASRNYYLDIYDAFKENIKIFVAKVDGEIVTGSIELQFRDTHYSWIGNPKPKYKISPSPNDLLIWESVRYACEHGFRYYVTMSAAGDNRLYSYYASKFDPELKVYFSAKKNSIPTGIFEKGYKHVLKPLFGQMKNLNFG